MASKHEASSGTEVLKLAKRSKSCDAEAAIPLSDKHKVVVASAKDWNEKGDIEK